MADARHSGAVKLSVLLETMQKILPNLTQEFIDHVPIAFQMNNTDVVSPAEFDMLFNPESQQLNSVPKPSTAKLQNAKKSHASNEEYTSILKYLAECLDKEGLTPLRFFKQADRNFNQVLSVEEIKEHVKQSLPNAFAGLNFKKLMKALDVNQNEIIEQQEFVDLMEKSSESKISTKQFEKTSSSVSASVNKQSSGGYNPLRKTNTVKTEASKTAVESVLE